MHRHLFLPKDYSGSLKVILVIFVIQRRGIDISTPRCLRIYTQAATQIGLLNRWPQTVALCGICVGHHHADLCGRKAYALHVHGRDEAGNLFLKRFTGKMFCQCHCSDMLLLCGVGETWVSTEYRNGVLCGCLYVYLWIDAYMPHLNCLRRLNHNPMHGLCEVWRYYSSVFNG